MLGWVFAYRCPFGVVGWMPLRLVGHQRDKHAVGFTLNTWLPVSCVVASLLWGVVVWGVGGVLGWVCVPARVLAVCGWGVGVVGCL